jgi:hypothetical protein
MGVLIAKLSGKALLIRVAAHYHERITRVLAAVLDSNEVENVPDALPPPGSGGPFRIRVRHHGTSNMATT